MNYADRVKDTSTSTGTGNFVLSGATPSGYQPLSALGGAGVTFGYVIDGGVEWEVGIGTITAANTFSRAPSASSNGGAAVNFSAGTKAVFHSATAAQFAKYQSTNTASFATVIPLTAVGAIYMPQQNVSSVLAFTVAANPVQGALAYLRLVADGTNVPTFTGFKEWGGSLGYDNRPGIVNEIQYFYDGYDPWFSISQAVGAVAVDTIAPTASSAAVANSAPTTVAITMSEAMDSAYMPAASAFTVGGHAVSSVAISGTVINLTVTPAFANGEAARTVDYTQPGTNAARDVAGNLLASFSGRAITNNVNPADTTAPTFSSAQVTNSQPAVIVLTFNEVLAAVAPAASAFAASGGRTVTAVGAPSGATIAVTVSAAYANGDVITISYTQPGANPLQDAAGNQVVSFGPSAVTNNVSPAAGGTNARLAQLVRMTESGSGPYTYTGDGSNIQTASPYGPGGVATQKLASGADGSIAMQASVISAAGEPFLGLTTQSTLVSYPGLAYGMYGNSANSRYAAILNGAIIAPNTATFAPQANDFMRLRRSGTTIYAEAARAASPTTWTVVHTFSSASTGDLYPQLMVALGTVLSNVTGVGLT